MKTKIVISTIAACALVNLVGCGGGSSSSSEPETTAKVTGVAVDDLILNGVVEAKNLDTVLANGRTSSTDGSYSLNLDYSGVVTLEVSCDEKSQMLNIDTKVKTECPTDVQLRSIAEVKEGVEQNVSISPITEVVVARAEELAGGNAITSDALKQARSDIGQLFGIDPIAGSPTDGTYKTIVNAIHEVAKENGTNVMEITKNLAEALSDGKAENEDVIMALVEEMNNANISNLLTDTNGTATAVELDNVEDLDLAKALIKELRTEVVTASEFVDDEIVNIEKDVDSAIFDTEYMTSSIDSIIKLTVDMVENNDTSNSDTIDGKTYEVKGSDGSFSYTISDDDNNSWSGTLEIPEALLGDDAEDELNKEQQLAIDIQGDVPLGDNVASGSENKQTVALNIKTDRKNDITSMSIMGKVSSNGTSIEIKALDLDIKYSDVDDISKVSVSKFALEGVVGSYTINGTLNIKDYIINDSLEDNSDFNNEAYIPSSLTFEGSITNTQGSSLNGNLNIKLDNAKTIDLDSDDEPLVTASFNGTLAMKDRPALITNLSYKNTLDKDNIVNNINLSYTYGSTVINSTVVMDEDMENGHILVSSQNGVQADLTIEDEDIKDGSKLTKDGKLMGTFEYRDDAPVVKYIDGYFETLF